MGAEQSYQKAVSKNNYDIFYDDIEDLQEYLKHNDTTVIGKEYNLDDIDVDKYSLFKLLSNSVSKEDRNKVKDTSDLLDKIKMSLDMFVLYDNYNLKHRVLIKDLSKKLKNQNKNLKNKSEEVDTLQVELNDIKIQTEKNNKIKLFLIIMVILLVILIGLICILLYLKFN